MDKSSKTYVLVKVFCCYFLMMMLLFIASMTTTASCVQMKECYEICSQVNRNNNETVCKNINIFCRYRDVNCFIGLTATVCGWFFFLCFVLYVFCVECVMPVNESSAIPV